MQFTRMKHRDSPKGSVMLNLAEDVQRAAERFDKLLIHGQRIVGIVLRNLQSDRRAGWNAGDINDHRKGSVVVDCDVGRLTSEPNGDGSTNMPSILAIRTEDEGR